VLTGGAIWLLFNTGNAIAVAAPAPTSRSAASECAALTKSVPHSMEGQDRRGTNPSSPMTAAWGSPAITLRCGVPEPAVLRPGSRSYNPSADEAFLNGIAWLIEKTSGGYRFTAAQRAVYIEVDVPSAYKPETSPLIDLSDTLIAAIPRSDGKPGADIEPADGGPLPMGDMNMTDGTTPTPTPQTQSSTVPPTPTASPASSGAKR
jgi:hypothetical protein